MDRYIRIILMHPTHFLSGLHSVHTSSVARSIAGLLSASKCFGSKIPAGGGEWAFQHSTTTHQDCVSDIAGWLTQKWYPVSQTTHVQACLWQHILFLSFCMYCGTEVSFLPVDYQFIITNIMT